MIQALPSLRRKILRSFWIIACLYGLLGFLLVVSVQIASRTSPRMIHVNYDSISAADHMREALAALKNPSSYPHLDASKAKEQFENALKFEEGNITEVGEGGIANQIRANWDSIKSSSAPPTLEQFTKINHLINSLVKVNEKGMFQLAQGNEELSRRVMVGSIAFFLFSLFMGILVADGLAQRISTPLKRIAEALHRRPSVGRKLKLVEPNTLELLILTTELNRLWERVLEAEKVNVQEMVQQKSKLESVLESVEDALLVVDQGGYVSQANKTLLEIIDLPMSEVIGKPWRDLSSLGENYVKLRKLLGEEMQHSAEVELVVKSVKYQFSARSRKILSPDGTMVANLYLLHDITEKLQRHRLRAELIDLLSHELKTPLQSLGTATEILVERKNQFPDDLKLLVDTVSEDYERIRGVANEFVQVTQTQAKVLKLKMEKVVINQAIVEWIKPFKVIAKDRGVHVDLVQEGSEIIYANVDTVKFPWVISNLLSNALRFSPKDSTVTIKVSDLKKAVEICVKDKGPGISQGEQEKIFEPFFQSKMPAWDGTRGLFGVGLTIAKEVVEAHDGRLEYQPNEPKGSIFRIVLPFPELDLG